MNYKDKQDWIEAVMASDLGAATKVYAYGIFKHMYGNKTDAFPSAKGISKATGLATGKYYLHTKQLEDAGFIEVTHRSGRSNKYLLMHPPTEVVGTHPQKGEHLPTEGVTPTHKRGTNTTSNTTKKTLMEDNKNAPVVADAPTDTSDDVVRDDEDSYSLSSSELVRAPNIDMSAYNYVVSSKGVTKQLDPPTEVVGMDEFEKGAKYLDRLLEKNTIVGKARSLARQRYADEEYEPTITGIKRAGWVLSRLTERVEK